MIDFLGYMAVALLVLAIPVGVLIFWHDEAWGFGSVLGLGLLGMTLGITHSVMLDNKQRSDFFLECLQYRKQYECTAMWRAGENKTSVVPMPVIIPSR